MSTPERTMVPLEMPLGLVRFLTGILSEFAEGTLDIMGGGDPEFGEPDAEEEQDMRRAVVMAGLANDVLRYAGEKVETGFNNAVMGDWKENAPRACALLAGVDRSPEAVGALMDLIDGEVAELVPFEGSHVTVPTTRTRH